jgi:hypothetical protein
MSRHLVALAILAAAGAALIAPSDATAGRGGGLRAGGFRAPAMIQRHIRPVPRLTFRPAVRPVLSRPALAQPGLPHHFGARRTIADVNHLFRRHHRSVLTGWIYPYTLDADASYVGAPYGPDYGPPPVIEPADAPATTAPVVPRASNVRSEDSQDACRAERVTVPAKEGEREITVVRC